MTIEVRRAVAQDADTLSRIAIEAYAKYVSRMTKAPAPVFYNYQDVIGEGHTWVLAIEDRVKGMVTLVPRADHILFRNLAVALDSQRKGLGHRALELAECEAIRLGKPEIRLWTNVHMPENIPFYTRAGFVETHRGDLDGYSFIYMAKRLPLFEGTVCRTDVSAERACQ